MKYVEIIAETHAQALQKLRNSYGSEALVYSEKEIPARSYVKRMLGKKEYKIEAALNEKKKNSVNVKQQLSDLQKIISSTHVEKDPPTSDTSLRQVTQDDVMSPIKEIYAPVKLERQRTAGQEFLHVLDREFTKKKPTAVQETSLQELAQDIHFIKNHIASLAQNVPVQFAEKEFENLFQYLRGQEFSLPWSKQFTEQVKNDLAKNLWNDRKKIWQMALSHLEKKIPIASPNAKQVIVLVGPTGVGKTTTLAKLSARMQLQENKKVSLVTLDNYRIAATEQLRLFANIIEIPVHVFKEAKKFKEFVENDNSDVILVDTTGFSHYNRNFLLEQKEFFSGKIEKKIEKHLTLSATTRAQDARLIVEHFQEHGLDKLILTKMDESSCFGNFAELADDFKLPFSYFTIGQEVSKDHLQADSEFLAKKILSDFA